MDESKLNYQKKKRLNLEGIFIFITSPYRKLSMRNAPLNVMGEKNLIVFFAL